MANQEKPRDVSGVELLMNNHQGLKAEIDAREENFTICVNLGKDLMMRKHPRSAEVRERLIQLAVQRGGMVQQWEDGWEYLQLILEVYQFARDASVAEAWLMAHEPYLNSHDFGETLDAVEILLKKHEAFERAAATQEERFLALERITTLELRQRQKAQQEEYERQHPGSKMPQKQTHTDRFLEEFLPPPEPEPEPEPVIAPVKEVVVESRPSPSDDTIDTAAAAAAQQKTHERSSADTGPPPSAVDKLRGAPELGRSATLPRKVQVETPEDKKPVTVKRAKSTPGKPKPGSAHEAASGGESENFEGMLVRKHEWESTTKKASNRSWEKVFSVQSAGQLLFYKDQKHARADPKGHFRAPIELEGSTTVAATDYSKRPNVFRLKLSNGGDFLFQAKDEEEMTSWIGRLNSASGADPASSPSRAQTMPAGEGHRGEEPKKRSFFTLGKKK